MIRSGVRSGGGGLGHRRLWTESQGVVMREDDPLAGRPTIPLRSLEGRWLVLLRGNPHFGANLLELAAAQGVSLVPLHGAEDFPSLHWMVRAGFGVAPCSLRLADALPAGLVARAVRPAPPRLEIHAIWPGSAPCRRPPAGCACSRRAPGERRPCPPGGRQGRAGIGSHPGAWTPPVQPRANRSVRVRSPPCSADPAR